VCPRDGDRTHICVHRWLIRWIRTSSVALRPRAPSLAGKVRGKDIREWGCRGGGPPAAPHTSSVYFFGIIDLLQQWDKSKVCAVDRPPPLRPAGHFPYVGATCLFG